MKKQVLILIILAITNVQAGTDISIAHCGLNSDLQPIIEEEKTVNTIKADKVEAEKSLLCIQKACEEMLKEISSDQSDEEEVSISEKEVNKCNQETLKEYIEAQARQRKIEIERLKDVAKTSEELTLLIELIIIERIPLVTIKEILFSNVELWNENIVSLILDEKIFNEVSFMEYIKSYDYKEIHMSKAFEALLKNGHSGLIKEYITREARVTEAILSLKPNENLVEIILNNPNMIISANKYLGYSKEILLNSSKLLAIFIKILNENIENNSLSRAFIETFQNEYKEKLWAQYIIHFSNPEKNQFEEINLSEKQKDLDLIVDHFYEADFSKLITTLQIVSRKNVNIFNSLLEEIISRSTNIEENNTDLLSLINQNINVIEKSISINFIELSSISYNDPTNIYYVNEIAKNSLTTDKYFDFTKRKFQLHRKSDILTYAAKALNTTQLEGLLAISEEYNIDLISGLNIDSLPNKNEWIKLTKGCIINNCQLLDKLLSIRSTHIFNIVFKYGTMPQGLNVISKFSKGVDQYIITDTDINLYIETLNNRKESYKYTFMKMSLRKLIEGSQNQLEVLLNAPLDEDISLENLSLSINSLIKSISILGSEKIDKRRLSDKILQIETILKKTDSNKKDVALKQFYELIELEKISIRKGVTEKTEKKSILSGLQNIYNKDYKSKWATNFIISKMQLFDNLVMKTEDINEALYNSYLSKYALAIADEGMLQNLTYEEIDKLSKMMKYYTELPRKLSHNLVEMDYKDISKEYIEVFNNYNRAYRNEPINIPVYCETGSNCTFDMKYTKNIGALTSIGTTLQTLNFQGTGLKVYKNRDITMMGSLDDVLYIDSSVSKEYVPDQRSRAKAGIQPNIKLRTRRKTVCLIRIKLFIGSKCIKRKTYKLKDEYVATRGFAPEDGKDGFRGADSSKLVLNLNKINKSKFARIIILNNTGKGGPGQLGGIWKSKPNLRGKDRRDSSELDMSRGGFGLSFGSPGNGKRVSLREAIPDYKVKGSDGSKGKSGIRRQIIKNQDTPLFDILVIGKEPK